MNDLADQIRDAIRLIQFQIRWKPGSATSHLLKRKVRNHLPLDASLSDYERMIKMVVSKSDAQVYIYWHDQAPYPTIVSEIEEQYWLVMVGLDGVLESAYLVERPDRYLNRPVFEFLGSLGEVLHGE